HVFPAYTHSDTVSVFRSAGRDALKLTDEKPKCQKWEIVTRHFFDNNCNWDVQSRRCVKKAPTRF
ncbi:uncharacterized, partial [Tachysurus ichikawai]